MDSDPSIYISLVVPAYNEEERCKLNRRTPHSDCTSMAVCVSVPVMMDEAMPYLEGRRETDPMFTYEVIIVNDGSKDDTSDVALKYVRQYGVEKVRLLEFVKNRGKGGAIRLVCLHIIDECPVQ